MRTRIALLLTATLAVAPAATAQRVEIPQHRAAHTLHTGVHAGAARTAGAAMTIAYRGVIDAGDAPWLRVDFGDYALGERSKLVVRSRENGDAQHLDAKVMGHWNGTSARFAGGVLDLELHVAPGDEGVFVEVEELIVGEWVDGEVSRDICGDDDRTSSSDPAVGRVDTGCTGWIISSGSLLTAGHCGNISMIEFQVPASNCDGTINPSNVVDQYPIDPASRILVDGPGGTGDDWGVFRCNPNDSTDVLPTVGQQAFIRITKDYEKPAFVRITGYGSDQTPAGCTGGLNGDNGTQQTQQDEFVNETGSGSDVRLKYKADTEGGNSGSPVLALDSPPLAIGIHTDGGCDNILVNGNFGTSFESDDLESAINDHPDPLAVYADKAHPVTSGFNGSVMRPYHQLSAAAANTPSGGLLSIVTGAYDESLVISTAMRIAAPVGRVVIGSGTLGRDGAPSALEADPLDEGGPARVATEVGE